MEKLLTTIYRTWCTFFKRSKDHWKYITVLFIR